MSVGRLLEVVECCPNCGKENLFNNYDVENKGWSIICKGCGARIMLCDLCFEYGDNDERSCDWCDKTGCFREQKGEKK